MHSNIGNAPEDIGLVYMAARWYSPTLGRFISADTIVPDPANPQQFNRYSYALNNAVRYTDPSGHCVFGLPCPEPVKNAIIGVAEFGLGVMAQVAHDNALSPQVRDSLTATPGESAAMIAGRVVGGYVTLTQSVAEMFGGGGMVGGGAGVCGTGVLCPAGAGAMVAGSTMATHGAVVAGNSLHGLAENISNLTSSGSGGSSGEASHYKSGKPYTNAELENMGANIVRKDTRNVNSSIFKEFIRSQGQRFRSNEWNKIMETWELPDTLSMGFHNGFSLDKQGPFKDTFQNIT